jgi:hypothetical protein
MCMFCRSLFVLLSFFFWPLCCLFFFDIRILITPLVSSSSSWYLRFHFLLLCILKLFGFRNIFMTYHWVWFVTRVTRRVKDVEQEPLNLPCHVSSHPLLLVLMGFVLFNAVRLQVLTFLVPCCYVRCDFCVKLFRCLSTPICHALLMLFVFI